MQVSKDTLPVESSRDDAVVTLILGASRYSPPILQSDAAEVLLMMHIVEVPMPRSRHAGAWRDAIF